MKTFLSKTQLAQAYFPYIDSESARHKLMQIINDDAELLTQLRATGYVTMTRMFSPRQVDMIMERFGNPFA